jgi:hypothetical protein
MSRDSSVDIATAYGLDGRGSIPKRGKIIPLLHSVQTNPRVHRTSYTKDTGGSFPEDKTRSRMVELYLHSATYLHGIN